MACRVARVSSRVLLAVVRPSLGFSEARAACVTESIDHLQRLEPSQRASALTDERGLEVRELVHAFEDVCVVFVERWRAHHVMSADVQQVQAEVGRVSGNRESKGGSVHGVSYDTNYRGPLRNVPEANSLIGYRW